MIGPLKANSVVGGRYQVKKYIDQGGMQFVYSAVDTLVGRAVALKTPKNRSAEKRFERSAIVAARVNHPNVAKTLDYIEEGDNQYLIEELIEGKDLKASLLSEHEYIDPYFTAQIAHHLAKGLAAAHHAGVIHRDLKPTNIMIKGALSLQELKITDFGIAKMAEEELIEAVEGGEQSITASQTAIGALPYMAPEAILDSRQVGKPADVWSIGAIVFHLLSGIYPFGQGLKAVPLIVEAKPVEIPKFVASNPQFKPLCDELLSIAFACLSRDPSRRPSADELVALCSQLCYTTSERRNGKVKSFMHNAWGFIHTENGDVFFHKECVYGKLPKVGDNVSFSAYHGGGANRALPVLRLKSSDGK